MSLCLCLVALSFCSVEPPVTFDAGVNISVFGMDDEQTKLHEMQIKSFVRRELAGLKHVKVRDEYDLGTAYSIEVIVTLGKLHDGTRTGYEMIFWLEERVKPGAAIVAATYEEITGKDFDLEDPEHMDLILKVAQRLIADEIEFSGWKSVTGKYWLARPMNHNWRESVAAGVSHIETYLAKLPGG